MTTLTEIVQEFKRDPDFCRGFRRGAGLVLIAVLLIQCLICTFWPLAVR